MDPMPRKKTKTPFSISPSPTGLFLTPALEAVIFRVRFTVDERQGFSVILGEPGLGKTSVVRYLHSDYDASDDTLSILIPSPSFKTEYAFLTHICTSAGIPLRRSAQAQQRELEGWLGEQYAADRNVVLFIDEAQNLTPSILELVRALLNYETDESKLVQVVLAGQIELRNKLLAPQQKALYSRLVAPSVLSPLAPDELNGMIEHRCRLRKVKNPFPPEAVDRLFALTGGIPRSALRLCAISFEMAKLSRLDTVQVDLIDTAYGEMQLEAERNGEEDDEQ
jgi:general secretion pathway protein A